MMEALLRLLEDRETCCRYYSLITGTTPETPLALASAPTSPIPEIYANLNQSQITAVESTTNPLCLVWGPPGKHVHRVSNAVENNYPTGTGKTTVVVRILRRLLSLGEETKILMTASTHNGEV
jgi:regulator of nonsense transcripts 1